MMNPNNIGECVCERERESVAGVCRRRDEGEIWHVFREGEGVGRSCVSVFVSPRWRGGDAQEQDLTNIKLLLANPSLRNLRIMTSGVRVRKNKEKGRTEAGNKWEGVRGERQRRGCSSDLV